MAIQYLPQQPSVWMSPRGVPVNFPGRQGYIQPYHDESLIGMEVRDALRGLTGTELKVPSHMSPEDFKQLQDYRANLKSMRRQRLLGRPYEWWLELTGRGPEARRHRHQQLGQFYAQNPMLWSRGEQRVYRNPAEMEAVQKRLSPEQFQRAKYLGQTGYLGKALAMRQPIEKTKPRPAPKPVTKPQTATGPAGSKETQNLLKKSSGNPVKDKILNYLLNRD